MTITVFPSVKYLVESSSSDVLNQLKVMYADCFSVEFPINDKMQFLVEHIDNEIRGIINIDFNSPIPVIYDVCVAKNHRRKGVIDSMFRFIISQTPHQDYALFVDWNNVDVVNVYAKHFFCQWTIFNGHLWLVGNTAFPCDSYTRTRIVEEAKFVAGFMKDKSPQDIQRFVDLIKSRESYE